MTIRYPASFTMLVVAWILTAALFVSFAWQHWVGLVIDLALIAGIRTVAHREVRRRRDGALS